MSFDFDQPIDRRGSHATKLDGRVRKFGSADVMPLWIADMDFAAPPCVVEALQERARHPIYGYTQYPASLSDALIGWCARRHRRALAREATLPVNGVLASLSAALQAVTAPGDAVIVQPPVYGGFFHATSASGRKLVFNPLRESDGRYTMDLAQLEQCAKDGARALLLCNPHNPVGRVWSEGELTELLQLARRHELAIISDEVHGDLALPGARHIPLATLARADDRIISIVSPSKSFNLQSLALSVLVASRPELHAAVARKVDDLHLDGANPFAIAAAEAAWSSGDAWLGALLGYLAGTRDFVAENLRARLPALRMQPAEAGYLLWLDCRALGMDDAALRDFFVQRCKLGLNPGSDFGPGGSGFMRMNIGTPRQNIEAALDAIEAALG
ncbi:MULTISPECIES: MalY/PatB family protein [unclassified Rhodanobacter]|uniref:cysteine-S-conjugate beta-lyase n=1 Tax=Rhodanobacter humi TaxID=1888173 RepID=A0ABV4AWK5_9GAMM